VEQENLLDPIVFTKPLILPNTDPLIFEPYFHIIFFKNPFWVKWRKMRLKGHVSCMIGEKEHTGTPD